MRGFTLWFMALSFAPLPACDSGGAEGTAEDSHASPEASQVGCIGLPQAECEASSDCEPFLAWPKELGCSTGEPAEPPSFMGCGSVGVSCSASWTWAHATDSQDDWRLFITGCFPDGWTRAEEADLICDSKPCQDLSLAECKTTAYCLPINGTPVLEGCTYGEAVYAGCWTGQAIKDGELVFLECNQISTWAHPADSQTQWYRFPDSCVPDGWVTAEQSPCE